MQFGYPLNFGKCGKWNIRNLEHSEQMKCNETGFDLLTRIVTLSNMDFLFLSFADWNRFSEKFKSIGSAQCVNLIRIKLSFNALSDIMQSERTLSFAFDDNQSDGITRLRIQ